MADTTKTVAIIFKGTDSVSPALNSIEQNLGDIGSSANDAENKMDDLGNEVEEFGGKSAAIDKVSTALKALAVALVVDRFIDANVAAEKFQKTMEFATGSLAEAATEWDYVVDVADRFGVGIEETATAYSKFIAQTSTSKLATSELKTIFEGVVGTLSLVGASTSDASEALRQMGQGIAKDKAELEDLKSVADRVPGGMYALADSIGVTVEEMYKMVSAGEIGADELFKFGESLQSGLDGVNFDSFTNSMERLKNTIDLSLVDLGDAGLFSTIGKSIEGATVILTGFIGTLELVGGRAKVAFEAFKSGDFSAAFDGDAFEQEVLKVTRGIESAKEKFLDFGDAAQDSVSKAAEPLVNLNDQLQEIIPNAGLTVEQIEYIDRSLNEVLSGPLGEIKSLDPFSGVSESAKKATVEIDKTAIELEKIASNERIANIEAKMTLDVAGIEAGAKRAVAIIEGISTTIESTGDLLGGLFSNLGEADSFRELFQIEDQIELENERRQEALDLQKSLTSAQIAEIKARTKSLQSGNGIITINGDGLQPHLEAFMFEILSAIQVRVNAQGYEMLLGA